MIRLQLLRLRTLTEFDFHFADLVRWLCRPASAEQCPAVKWLIDKRQLELLRETISYLDEQSVLYHFEWPKCVFVPHSKDCGSDCNCRFMHSNEETQAGAYVSLLIIGFQEDVDAVLFRLHYSWSTTSI